ncbi:MAG: chorismate synthase [Spirochaetia bacterium]
MAGSSFGTLFKITTFGESHGPALGVIVDGVPPNIDITEGDVQRELDRRKPGQSNLTTPRKESDTVHFLSGVFTGKTTGTPLAMVLYNTDQQSGAYEPIKELLRPGHADYTYYKKYGIRDWRGSGRASGRETASRVAAGAVAKKILRLYGIEIRAYTVRAAGIACTHRDMSVVEENPMRACDSKAAAAMAEKIEKLKERGDSTGGIVECSISGAPSGLGEPVFNKLDAELARAIVSIGSVKGIEFGAGFAAADMNGSEHNDPLVQAEERTKESTGDTEDEASSPEAGSPFGNLQHSSNNSGGVEGGISNGEEILFRAAVKPTSSISKPQQTVDIDGNERTIVTEGRHDPCICPRIVPVVEAMSALVLIDLLLQQNAVSDTIRKASL